MGQMTHLKLLLRLHQVNVSERSIKRAKQVSRAGRSEEVISGEKSASAVIVEERENVSPAIFDGFATSADGC